jgi:hypothetical protein
MSDKRVVDMIHEETEKGDKEDHHAPGTMVLVLVLLACFVLYYFANWKALADVWHVR